MSQLCPEISESAILSQFASDNTSAICPEALQALTEANIGFSAPYGDDPWTARAAEALRDLFETNCEVFFCFNGTAANSMSLSHICRPFHGVIAHPAAHIENDECGGPEFFSHGSKLLLGEGDDGKLNPESVSEICERRTDIHFPKPRVMSLTQSTELGTCYSVHELERLAEKAQRHSLAIHMDGARFANACARLRVPPRAITSDVGIDVLSFGGTKNGMPVGEAVLFFNQELAKEFDFRCKQAGQLSSKMRYLAAPWAKMIESGAWLNHATHANEMTARLATALQKIPGFDLVRPQEVNSTYFSVEQEILNNLRTRGATLYDFIGGGVRFMCSWQTTESDVDLLVHHAHQASQRA